MSLRPIRSLAVLAAALALGLGGCVSLLPKAKPSQLYRFDVPSPAPATVAASGQKSGVVLSAIDFPRAATGDGILTVSGTELAYVAGARWVAPAAILFREALSKAFGGAQRTIVVNPGDAGSAAAILRLSVLSFETRYEAGAPTVVETVQARFTRTDGVLIGEQLFEVPAPASANRVPAIVAAYDQATREVLTQLVAWADQHVPPPPPTAATGR